MYALGRAGLSMYIVGEETLVIVMFEDEHAPAAA